MTTPLFSKPTPEAKTVALKIQLLSEGGRLLTTEPVTDADLAPLRTEAWFEGFLRQGLAGVPFREAVFGLVPIFKADSETVCAGFALEAKTPRGGLARCEFFRPALREVAQRAVERLVKCGVLAPGDKYHFEIVLEDGLSPPNAIADAVAGPGKMTVRTPPLHFLSVPLRALLKEGRPVDEQEEQAFHVFLTESAWAASEKYSRQGAAADNPIETGAALAGFLCRANDAGEAGDVCVVVTDVLEAMHSTGTELSLTYTGESWNRIGRIMAARQVAQPAFRLCGSSHGHNFSPGEPCAGCFTAAGPCGAHNVLPSSSDLLWTQSVFAHQPWALCQIFGSNARGEALQGLFTLRQGRFQRRGFFVLPSFDPEQWKVISGPDLNPK